MIIVGFNFINEFNILEEKEKLEKKCIDKKIVNIVVSVFNSFFFFDFFDSLLFLLFNIELKVLLVNVNISNRISIVF